MAGASPGGARSVGVLVYGEVLWDGFPDGRRVLGGAPFNVAWGLKGFGQDPLLVSAVGADEDGERIRAARAEWGLRTEGEQTDREHATGEVDIGFQDGEPVYDICRPRAWDFMGDEGWRSTGMLYHGLLALRSGTSRRTLEKIRERSGGARRFFDINLRPPHDPREWLNEWMKGADWLKLNLGELAAVLGEGPVAFGRHGEALERLRARYGIRNVLLTAGGEGLAIQGEDGEAECAPAPVPEKMVDTVGAGDSVSAVVMDGILRGWTAREMVERAGRFAARVCGRQGATAGEKEFYRHE